MIKTTEFYAFLSEYDGEEGTVCVHLLGVPVPLVNGRASNLDRMRAMAQLAANMEGRTITVAKFTVREDIEVIKPVHPGFQS